MAALLGDMAEAARYFELTRERTGRRGERGLLAMADHDEALAMMRQGGEGAARVVQLCDASAVQFRSLGMDIWEQRAVSMRDDAAARKGGHADHGLTPRELEVLRLIAGGSTTNEIAAELVLSSGTVERHITNIYGKIGARSRADATAYAFRHGLA